MVRRPIENIEFEEISVYEVERLIEKLCVVLCIESALIAQLLSTVTIAQQTVFAWAWLHSFGFNLSQCLPDLFCSVMT